MDETDIDIEVDIVRLSRWNFHIMQGKTDEAALQLALSENLFRYYQLFTKVATEHDLVTRKVESALTSGKEIPDNHYALWEVTARISGIKVGFCNDVEGDRELKSGSYYMEDCDKNVSFPFGITKLSNDKAFHWNVGAEIPYFVLEALATKEPGQLVDAQIEFHTPDYADRDDTYEDW